MPKSLTKDEASATETYAKFIAKPFEAGYGRTVGNSLRRVLLSSLEGAAITSIRITGAQHEFATLTGIVEDVTDIVLNLKKIKFKRGTADDLSQEPALPEYTARRFQSFHTCDDGVTTPATTLSCPSKPDLSSIGPGVPAYWVEKRSRH